MHTPSSFPWLPAVNSLRHRSAADSSESLRKTEKDRVTNTAVAARFIHSCRKRARGNAVSKAAARPCISPQRTNVQSAPCHSPLTRNTASRFRICRLFPFRFPPSGRYTYWDRKRDRVICHLRQNSRTEAALKGESKFSGSRKPNIAAMPLAMSQ